MAILVFDFFLSVYNISSSNLCQKSEEFSISCSIYFCLFIQNM